MRKLLTSFTLVLIAQTGLAHQIVLDNETNYPNNDRNVKIAIQWAVNAREMQIENRAITSGLPLDFKSLQVLNQSGKIAIDTPPHAEYFRVLVWSKGKNKPDLLTNWVGIVHKNKYILKQDQLIPASLVSGVGC